MGWVDPTEMEDHAVEPEAVGSLRPISILLRTRILLFKSEPIFSFREEKDI